MPGERRAGIMRNGLRLATLGLTLACAGCGGNLLNTSSLNPFATSSKATTGGSAAGVTDTNAAAATDIECPSVEVRTGAATLLIGSKPGEGEPAALDVRYSGSIVRTARECHVNAGVMTMKVGIEGRVITGPAGGPGNVDVPIRLAVVHEGVNPKPIVSKFARVPVTISGAIDRVTFTHVDSDIAFPLPTPLGDIDAYVVYVGFDSTALQPEKPKPQPKKPAAKPRVAKPKQS